MNNYYRIILLLITLIFLTTFNPNRLDLYSDEKKSFFSVENIYVLNNNLIKENEILENLDHIYNKNIFFIEKFEIEKPLKQLNFLNKIEVKKKYPNTIIIKIYETKPIAILFKAKDKYLIDSLANLISIDKNYTVDHFPSIFGKNAEYNFIYFFNQLKNNNFPQEKIENYYYFQIGRWDLQLSSGQIIKFPSQETEKAIIQSVELLNKKDFVDYNIIDLRINGKIVVE
tara:strand:- start:8892 stop:9575 length:684 start_codon:yes stop_codon:yes gene_type:complete